MRHYNFKIIFFGYLLACLHFSPAAGANIALSKTHDCTEIELEAVIDHKATREENLARLSQQFFQSINTIEHCNQERDRDGAASSLDSNSAANSNGANAVNHDNGGANSFASGDATGASSEQMSASADSKNSTNTDNTATTIPKPSGSMIGSNFDHVTTEPASAFAAPSASNMAGTTPQTSTTQEQIDTAEQDLTLTNGKTPDDIPDANNDSVFEAQIRAAAMAETDPDTKKNLWNEYRRYKGLPEQE